MKTKIYVCSRSCLENSSLFFFIFLQKGFPSSNQPLPTPLPSGARSAACGGVGGGGEGGGGKKEEGRERNKIDERVFGVGLKNKK